MRTRLNYFEKGLNTMTDYDNTNIKGMIEFTAELIREINGERDNE